MAPPVSAAKNKIGHYCHISPGVASMPSACFTPNSPGNPPFGNSRVTWPIFRPGRASALPYRCGIKSGCRSASAHRAIPSGPTKFFITASECRSTEASGNPATARICRSNWLAGHPSMVQCPELCGRGAISFASTLPSRSTNISTARTPTRSSASATRRAMRNASAAISGTHPSRGKG